MELKDKVAIVTGSGRGIGRAIALVLAHSGAALAIVDRNAESAADTASEIERQGGRALAIRTDITSMEEVNAMVAAVLGSLGEVHILVNNAGWTRPEPFVRSSPETWERLINVNLKGHIFCSRAVLDHMMERQRGKIISIASDAGRVGGEGQVVYGAAKGGIIAFTKGLAREMARHNITVNCVSPGMTETPLLREGMARSEQFVAEVRERENAIPLGRLGKPEDIAEMVLFLASSRADYITGQVISVSGGWTMVG